MTKDKGYTIIKPKRDVPQKGKAVIWRDGKPVTFDYDLTNVSLDDEESKKDSDHDR